MFTKNHISAFMRRILFVALIMGLLTLQSARAVQAAGKGSDGNMVDDLPDLIIESITATPANPATKENITFTVVIKNLGQAITGDFFVDLLIDQALPSDCGQFGDVYWRIRGLAAGASEIITLEYDGFTTDGLHTINGIVDTNCYIAESNENNNTRVINMTSVAALGSGTYDSTHSAFTFTGNWSSLTTTGPYNSTLNYSAAVGDYVTFSMSGSSFVLYYTQATNRGTIEVIVDNVSLATINSNGALVWQKTWTSPSLGAGEHTVKFVHASGTYIDIDAIQVIGP